jgi:hypothetical protein
MAGPDDGLYDGMAGVKTSPRRRGDIGSGCGERRISGKGRGIERAPDTGIKERRKGGPSC